MNLLQKLRAYLPEAVFQQVCEAGQEAAEQNCRLFLIGGSIRDMLLPERPFDWDIDLVSDSPQIQAVASKLHQRWGGQLQQFPQYGTAVLKNDCLDLDFARARTEVYAHPGANPEVQFATLAEDIVRRDFTINAMALNLWPEQLGQLYDPFEGYQDLQRGVLKALHERKFIEDPVRAWRAVRLSVSLNFELETETQKQLISAMNSGDFDGFFSGRVRNELYKVLGKAQPQLYLQQLSDFGVMRCLDPDFKWGQAQLERFQRAEQQASAYPENNLRTVLIMLLLHDLSTTARPPVYDQLHLPKAERQAWEQLQQLKPLQHWEKQSPAEVYAQLHKLNPLSLHVAEALWPETALVQAIQAYRETYRFVKLELSGKMLLEQMPPGPAMRDVLQAVLHAKLNGQIHTLADEQQWVQNYIKATPAAGDEDVKS